MAEAMKDCFAYFRGRCKALRELYCKNGECRFYKQRGTECDTCIYCGDDVDMCDKCKELRK